MIAGRANTLCCLGERLADYLEEVGLPYDELKFLGEVGSVVDVIFVLLVLLILQ